MICGKYFGKEITHHHIKPKYADGTDDYNNGSLLCTRCHCHIHKYEYNSKQYLQLTEEILSYMRNYRSYIAL
jgi:hypothetical protein